VLAHAHLPRGLVQCHPLASSPMPMAYGEMPSASPPHKAAATVMSLCALLRVCALSAFCRRAEPSPPSLPPCAGPCCPHSMRSYKRRPLPFICLCPHRCLPPVKPPRSCLASISAAPSVPSCLTSLLSSCAGPGAPTRPRVQVLEHHHRAPVRSATMSPSYSDALPLAFSCQTSAWDGHDTVGENLPVIWPLGIHCRSCHGAALCAPPGVKRAESAPVRAPKRRAGAVPGPALLVVGHVSRPCVARAGP
jgi:hypothetical protein